MLHKNVYIKWRKSTILWAFFFAQCNVLRPYSTPTMPNTTFETTLLAEINQLRRNPALYAHKLQSWMPHYHGTILSLPNQPRIVTTEGAKAVKEAISVLLAQPPLPPLALAQGLTKAANQHVWDQGKTGATGHKGHDSGHVWNRAERFGTWSGEIGENIAYGQNDVEGFVLQWLVDDGVADRGHRVALLGTQWQYMGAAIGPHPRYKQMCVLTLAVSYRSF
ncbi:MAG: CAP domain-containing protein [Rhodothermia bacterium]|nr:CAP domain-containing protein [Rhodothermia bacterium]